MSKRKCEHLFYVNHYPVCALRPHGGRRRRVARAPEECDCVGKTRNCKRLKERLLFVGLWRVSRGH